MYKLVIYKFVEREEIYNISDCYCFQFRTKAGAEAAAKHFARGDLWSEVICDMTDNERENEELR